ncbi:hypothetical protein [Streptomyces albogriseolus]|uniref:Uncharacterized protein n=1 Tax=Streptomyces albogriseolus TaxID=1887 RepID=A0ACC6UUI6_STRAO
MAIRDRSARTPRRGRAGGAAAASVRPPVTGTATGSWLVRGKDGRLTAYAPCEGGLLRWTEHRPGGPDWSEPAFFPVDGLTHLTVAQGADTYVHLLGRRERQADGAVQVDVVHAVQYQTGRPLTEWRSLGNPHRTPERAAQFGPPAAAVAPSGDVHVFARNAGGGLMMRREGRGGRWEPWADLRGAGLRDGVAATAAAGRVEVFAPAGGVTLTWGQQEPGAVPRRFPDVRPGALPGSAAALETAPGRLTWFWTDPAGAGLVCLRPGSWAVPLSGTPSDGANVLLRQTLDGYDCTVIAHRGRTGTVLVGVCGTEAEASGLWWGDTGRACVGDPALAHDARGRAVLAALGSGGELWVARQGDGPGLSFTDWLRMSP